MEEEVALLGLPPPISVSSYGVTRRPAVEIPVARRILEGNVECLRGRIAISYAHKSIYDRGVRVIIYTFIQMKRKYIKRQIITVK